MANAWRSVCQARFGSSVFQGEEDEEEERKREKEEQRRIVRYWITGMLCSRAAGLLVAPGSLPCTSRMMVEMRSCRAADHLA